MESGGGGGGKDPQKSHGVVLAVAFQAVGDLKEAGERAGVHARRAGAPGQERRQQLCLGHRQLGLIARPGRYWFDFFSKAQQRAFFCVCTEHDFQRAGFISVWFFLYPH